MNRHTALAVGVAAGGLAAAAFLPVAVAFAGPDGDAAVAPAFPDAPGSDAFTFGGITYDPFTYASDGVTETEGWGTVAATFGAAPLFEFGEVAPGARLTANDISQAIAFARAGQSFEVYNGTTDIGQAGASVDTANVLGMHSTQVTIADFNPPASAPAGDTPVAAAGVTAAAASVPATPVTPTVGSVYDVTDFGSAVKNIYWAIPGAAGAPTQIHDVMDVFGLKIPVHTSFDATNPFVVGAGFGGIHEGGHLAVSGPDAFTFGNFTYDPLTTSTTTAADGTVTVTNTEGWEPATTSFGVAPWFEFGRVVPQSAFNAYISPALSLAPRLGAQSFEVYNSAGTDLGTFNGAVNTMNFLGIQSTQVTIAGPEATANTTDVAPTLAVTSAGPPSGSVYDVTDFGSAVKNIYWAIPGAGPNGTTGIHDVLDLFGMKISLPTSFDAVNPFNVGAGFAGIDVGATAAAGTATAGSAAGPYAFTFGNFTYDPFTTTTDAAGDTVNTEGWEPATATIGAAPWFEFGQLGPQPAVAVKELVSPEALALRLAGGQTFEVYNGGTDLGTAYGQVDTANILGIQNTQVTIGEFDAAATDPTGAVPTVGSVYDVTQFPFGIENIYWAIPGAGPNGATSIHDVLDLFGIKIPILVNFDAADPFDVGAGFTGDLGGAATSAAADPLAFLGL